MRTRHVVALARSVYVSHLALCVVGAVGFATASNIERSYLGMELSNWRLDFVDAVALNLGSNQTAFAARWLLCTTLVSALLSTGLYLAGRRLGRGWHAALGAFVALSFLVNVPFLVAAGIHDALAKSPQSLAALIDVLSRLNTLPFDNLVKPFLVPFSWTPSLWGIKAVISAFANVWAAIALFLAGYLAFACIPRRRMPAPV